MKLKGKSMSRICQENHWWFSGKVKSEPAPSGLSGLTALLIVPLAPGTNYATVIYNASWEITNAYPSTFLPISPSSNYITFESLNGFGDIEVQLIEPSSQINQMEQVQISPYQLSTNDSLLMYESDLSLSVSYTPFGSSSSQTINPSSLSFELPYGSTAYASLYDSFHHLIGTASFNVTSSYNDIPIAANVTSVYFLDNQTSASFSGETISSNGVYEMDRDKSDSYIKRESLVESWYGEI